ncbi:Peptidase family C25 [Dyadobacter soli]|uniref:Peptidase family C25 n=1 Tax=Dyadobacter soli TaxID=659014 RepID=A0A1G7FDW9_9BACT|nr:C25 family cysteine peptidase [Dyadobacter soli]SDE74099.1 Peptidase family C25 [Dyadobacter soli]
MRYFTTWALLIVLFLIGHHSHAQWGAPYANSWIDYSKPYVRIGMVKKGLHRVSFSALPKDFPVNAPDKLQLWRRGKEVSIISTTNQEIVFYAVPNDGASDSLLYRPMSSRVNPYFSMYSDEGAYFLTVGDKPGMRVQAAGAPANANIAAETYHLAAYTAVFKEEYSLTTQVPMRPSFFNSYFEWGASRTGVTQDSSKLLVKPFKLENIGGQRRPKVKFLIHGRTELNRQIEVYVGKTAESLRLVATQPLNGFNVLEYAFDLNATDYDASKGGVIAWKGINPNLYDGYSLTYYTVEFEQTFDMARQASKEFNLPPSNAPFSKLNIPGTAADTRFLDITDADRPVLINGNAASLFVPRHSGKRQTLLATNETTAVEPARISTVAFKEFPSRDVNYIIITNAALMTGANAFAGYRASASGGAFKPLIADIRDIYNQFNYGEPSPAAIKKFMAYMLADGRKDKYLFLIGISITHNERMKRELPGEIPTIGYPGSDALLVEGLAGAPVNAPAIAVGRLSAISNQNIMDYLQKVKVHEAGKPEESGWRKKVLHLSGGKTTSEIVQLRDHLSALEPIVTNGFFGGTVKSYVKQQASQEVVSMDIAGDVNEGVGMITFLGHGGTTITDPDIGYAREAPRGYHNLNKYPLMFFSGCGVGNVFANRFNANPASPKAGDRITLSLDWLVASDRGAVAVIASSFETYVSPGVTYLHALYRHLFGNAATAGLPIGQIQLAVANEVLDQHNDKYNIGYVHQSVLQGDPALRLFNIAYPDYAVEPEEGVILLSESADKTIGESDTLRVSIVVSNLGRFQEGQMVPVEVTCSGSKGIHTQKATISSFASQRVLQLSFPNEADIKSVKVRIDPDQTLKEVTRDNNVSELNMDWDLVKKLSRFSSKSLKDNIPPLITVKADDRLLEQEKPLWPDPRITISVTDDHPLAVDTTLVEVFIKPCQNDDCEFKRIVYANNGIAMNVSENSLMLDYQSKLTPGRYELLVNAKDVAGNAAVQPYRMRFEIGEPETMQCELVVSPNPASSYVRFELKGARSLPLKSIQYAIYDQRGIKIADKSIPVKANLPTVEWYWQPDVVAGLYNYTVLLLGEGGETQAIKRGKVAIR